MQCFGRPSRLRVPIVRRIRQLLVGPDIRNLTIQSDQFWMGFMWVCRDRGVWTLATEFHVVAGVIFDAQGRILVAQRPAGKVLAGRWEFPGGKVATGEAPRAAVVRELREEIGIEVSRVERLMYYAAVYPERTIWLDVWVVEDWSGEPQGLDGQALKWVERSELHRHDILEADAPIVAALALASPACGRGRAQRG